MEYAITWGRPAEDVSIRTFGHVSTARFKRYMLEALSDRRWRPAMRVLLDLREADTTLVRPEDLRARVNFLIGERERLARLHIAVVVTGPSDYGLVRMSQGFSNDWDDGEIMDVALFYSVDDARAWLSRFPAPGTT